MNILLAMDGSPASDRAADFLLTFPWPPETRVTILHVAPQFWMNTDDAQAPLAELSRMERAEAERIISGWTDRLTSKGLNASANVVDGDPAEEIVGRARQLRSDLIVVGHRGLSDVRAFLLGSVSRSVIWEAPCSVLVVRNRAGRRKSASAPPRVLLAVDGSENSKGAVEFLQEFPLPTGSEIDCLHVMERKKRLAERFGRMQRAYRILFEAIRKSEREFALSLIRETADALEGRGMKVRRKVRAGHPAETIVAEAGARRSDMILLGSRGITGIRRVVLGSVSSTVAKHAPCPVLIVKRPGAA